MFGNKATRNPPNFETPKFESHSMNRSSDTAMKGIQKLLASKNFQSTEELKKYLNDQLVGKSLSDLSALMDHNNEPKTDLERAESLIDSLKGNESPSEIIRTAKQALKISQECLGAWLELGIHENDHDKALELFEQGIQHGRVRFADLIATLDGQNGLWGWVEARDFMRLLQQRAIVLELLGKVEDAIVAYQEMMVLNPNDNQGIRGDLLRDLMICRRIDDSRALLNRYPDDFLVDFVYGRVLIGFLEIMDKVDAWAPDADDLSAPITPITVMKRLGPEFDAAKKELRIALRNNPFVPWVITDEGLMAVKTPDQVVHGGPYEAVIYSQKWAYVWFVAVLPYIALTASIKTDLVNYAKSSMLKSELMDVLNQLESAEVDPWWDGFKSDQPYKTRNN